MGTELSIGVGGHVISDELIAGEHLARAKIVLGVHGVDDGDVSSSNPLPVRGSALVGGALPPDAFLSGWSDGTDLYPPRVFDLGAAERVAGVVLRRSGIGGSVEIGTASSPVRVDPTGTTTQPVTAAVLEATVGNRFYGGKVTQAAVVAAAGDNVLRTPAAGKTITLFWIALSSSQNNTDEVLATVKLGAKVVYETYLGNPGQFAHWEPIAADNPNDPLIVNLSASGQSVAVSFTFLEE